MRLAVFDLDHTLIPFDSGITWARFLIAEGVLDPAFEQRYLDHAACYVKGTVDMVDMQRLMLDMLAKHRRAALDGWRERFAQQVAARIPAAAHRLVRAHAGDVLCIATATTRYVAEPFAVALGVPHLVASEAQLHEGEFSGELAGEPCFREGKRRALERWLAALGRARGDFEAIVAYSDSFNDVPLLEFATHPVAVQPDARLRDLCAQRGWPIAESLDDARRQ